MENIPGQQRSTQAVANRFNELAQQEKWFEIQDELFGDDVTSTEPAHASLLPDVAGKKAVREKGETWVSKITAFHGGSTSAPLVAGDHFVVTRRAAIDVKEIGRLDVDQLMVYRVKNGQIISEQFFY
jgi:hypothetical protein